MDEDIAIANKGAVTRLPGILGKFAQKAYQDFKPTNPITAFRTIQDTDWESVLGQRPVQTITNAVRQAVHIKSPEFTESLKKLNELPDIAKITKLSGINFPNAIIRYSHIWTRTQVASLTVDAVDKVDSVLNYFHVDVPGYDWAKEYART